MMPTLQTTQRGLSLIELMIAVVLGIFITGGMIQLFVNSKQSYRIQENLSRVQENGRFAMGFITRDIRLAGYYGCLGGTTNIENNLNPGSSYDNYAVTITGTNGDGLNSSDSISTNGMAASSIYVVDTPATPSANLKVTDNSGLLQNEVVMVLDCTAGDLFQITNDPGTGGAINKDEVIHNTGNVAAGPGNLDKPFQKIYGTDAQIYRPRNVQYFIAANPAGEPALFQSVNGGAAQELVEGIESMQILYGADTNGDNTANYYVPAATGGLDMEEVISVRVSLLVSTLEDNIATQSASTTLTSHTSANDRRIRRIYTSTIAIRNRLVVPLP